MRLFRIICLFCLGLAFIECVPTGKKTTMYDAIVQRCPLVKNLTNIRDVPPFNSCSNWDRISKTQNLTDDTKNDLLCLLYFHSFTQYCNRTKEPTTDLSGVDFKVEMGAICDKLDIIPNQIEPDAVLRKVVVTKEDCIKLCKDSFGLVTSICSISYHYSHVPAAPAVNSHLMPTVKPLGQNKPQVVVSKDNVNPKPEAKTVAEPDNPPETTTLEPKVEGDGPPQTGEQTVNANDRLDDATNDSAKPVQPAVADVNAVHEDKENKVDKDQKDQEDKRKVEKQKPPPETLAPPKNEEPADVINGPNNQLEKNSQDGAPDAVGDLNDVPVVMPDEVDQPNMDSEEDAEDPSSPIQKVPKPMQTDETEAANFATDMDGDSYFFTYFMLLCVIFIVGYVCYHNKQKILALMLEGRRGKRQYRGRRPNSANYHKLDSNLEEAITSSCNKNTNNVIY